MVRKFTLYIISGLDDVKRDDIYHVTIHFCVMKALYLLLSKNNEQLHKFSSIEYEIYNLFSINTRILLPAHLMHKYLTSADVLVCYKHININQDRNPFSKDKLYIKTQ